MTRSSPLFKKTLVRKSHKSDKNRKSRQSDSLLMIGSDPGTSRNDSLLMLGSDTLVRKSRKSDKNRKSRQSDSLLMIGSDPRTSRNNSLLGSDTSSPRQTSRQSDLASVRPMSLRHKCSRNCLPNNIRHEDKRVVCQAYAQFCQSHYRNLKFYDEKTNTVLPSVCLTSTSSETTALALCDDLEEDDEVNCPKALALWDEALDRGDIEPPLLLPPLSIIEQIDALLSPTWKPQLQTPALAALTQEECL